MKRPHILGVDDGPFDKRDEADVPLVGIVMEGAAVVEGVAVTSFPVDGSEATAYLADWISDLKWSPTLDLIVFGGITIAGLGIVDLHALTEVLHIPAAAATRHDTSDSDLDQALVSAGFEERLTVVEKSPPARKLKDGLYIASAGASQRTIDRMIRASLNKALLPESLRIAHLVGTALVHGSSRGKV